MKTLMLIILLGVSSMYATGSHAQVKIDIDLKNGTIEQLFREIQNNSDYIFFYKDDILDNDFKVTIKLKNAKLKEILDHSFSKTDLEYVISERQVIVKKKEKVSGALIIKDKINTVQKIKVTGTVSDTSGQPLPGASVLEKGTSNGAQTDFDGNYTIEVEPGAILVVSYLGYVSKEVSLSSGNKLDIVLREDVAALDEVIVVGYGTQKKINVTGSVASIKAEDVVQTPAANVRGLLVGQIPGLISNQNPGLPGTDTVDLSIRGFGNPLVIVDGVESSFDRLDPNDIETISVLKDASAAIYGARAGNGVILVTTKRGKSGKAKINYHGWYGVQKQLTFPDITNAADFIQLGRNAIFNGAYDPANPNATIDYGTDFTEERLQQYRSGELPSYSWSDAMIRSSGAQIKQHNISASGGSDKVRYYTSLGTLSQNGIVNGDYDYTKFTITNNLDVNLTDNLSLSFNSSYIEEEQDYAAVNIGTIWVDLTTAQPIYNPFLPDPNRAPYSGFSERSPIARSRQNIAGFNRTKIETLAAAVDLKYDVPFLPGLGIGTKVNVRYRTLFNDRLFKPYDLWIYDPTSSQADSEGYIKQAASVPANSFSRTVRSGNLGNVANTIDDPRKRILGRIYVDYNGTFNEKHKIGALAFFEKEDNEFTSLTAGRRELLSPDIPSIVSGDNTLTFTGGTGLPFEYTRVSAAGRLNYAYDEKYLLEATLRADASSKFAKEVRWGYFPSVSLGWNMHKENFLAGVESLSSLKLRLSYSETGIDSNVPSTAFDYLTGFTETPGYYLGDPNALTTGIRTQGLVNPLITWEKTTLYNVGLDFSFLKGKIIGTIDAFYRDREDMLAFPSEGLSSTFGAVLPLTNLNSRNSRGFEISLGYRGQIGKDFTMSFNGGFGLARERFGHFEGDADVDLTDPTQVRLNKRGGNYVNRTFGYVTDGLLNTQAEVDEYTSQYTFADIGGTPKPGDIRYVDVNGDNVINEDDRRQIGFGAQPDMTFSLNTNFKYKGLSLSMLWQGASKFNVGIANQLRAAFGNERVPFELHNKYSWRQDPANPGVGSNPNAQLPAFDRDGARVWNSVQSDFWFKDATYVRLKTATLNYSLPKTIIEQIGLSNFDIYLSGNNLLTFSKLGIFKDVVDPEQATNNGGFTLPLLRTYTFGLRVGL
ncbi:TonB-dependent receptor [Seonamhaeicola marinus]|uniref:TonB-dependent receptor n=2 Tax=Seonamhaeicola marinus TaxID=1912246 RepID=A0A5D0J9Y7_9FLAO|nr:TonB-dependent receptor [Seonamhaeicola marinus]